MALYFKTEKQLVQDIFKGQQIYVKKITKESSVAYEYFDTYDKELLRQGILLYKLKDKFYLNDGRSTISASKATSAINNKNKPLITPDYFTDSLLKKKILSVVSDRPLFPTSVTQMVTKYSLYNEDKTVSITVTEKRAANFKSGYLYIVQFGDAPEQFTENVIDIFIKNGITECKESDFYKKILSDNKIYRLYKENKTVNPMVNNSEIEYKRVIKELSTKIRYFENYIKINDSEGLHDYRVALRSIRSLVWNKPYFFDSEELKEFKSFFKKISTMTTTARDLDVFKAKLLTLNLSPYRAKQVKQLINAIDLDIKENYTAFIQYMESDEYNNSWEQWQLYLSQESNRYEFDLLLNERFVKIKKSIDKKIVAATKNTNKKIVHELRKSIKNARYHHEFLYHPSLSNEFDVIISKYKKVQSIIGDWHDLEVQKELIVKYSKIFNKNSDCYQFLNNDNNDVNIMTTIGKLLKKLSN